MKKPRATISAPTPTVSSASAVAGTYEATVSIAVIRSSFQARSALTRASRGAFRNPPGYAEWPPAIFAERGISLSEVDDTTLILARLKLGFDFGSGITAGSSAELSEAIAERWPKLAEERTALIKGQGGMPYAQAAVTGEVNVVGEPRWGYVGNVNSGKPLALAETAPEGQRPEFDVYLQNLVRLDLQQRIEKRLA